MTSELRPAVEVWEADRELAIVALRAWAEQIGSGYSCPAAAQTMLMAATIMEADREAVRAATLREVADDIWAVSERRQEAVTELAKFKTLAETLATDLRECARALQGLRQIPGTGADGRLRQRIKEITDAAHEAVDQYKEARDAS